MQSLIVGELSIEEKATFDKVLDAGLGTSLDTPAPPPEESAEKPKTTTTISSSAGCESDLP